jgi:DNA mismatch repair protein MutS
MPPSLLQRADEILRQLEDKHVGTPAADTIKDLSAPKMQLSIFDAHTETFGNIRRLLENLDINRLTPVEALLKLQEIKGILK